MASAGPAPLELARAHRRHWLVAALLVAAVVLAYANTFRVPFLLDDRSAITENPTIERLGDLGTVLTPTRITTSGRPLLNLSFAINHAIGGQSVVGYHVVNLAIHAGAALVLFGVVRRTLRRVRTPEPERAEDLVLAGAVAAVWALHPLLTSAVTYVSQRAESMMGLFYLLTLYGFIRMTEAGASSRWRWLSVLACFAGMVTKEVMVTAPVVILLFDRVFVSRSFGEALARRWGYYALLVLSWVLMVYLAVATRLDERSVAVRAGADWINYALTEFKVIVLYVKLAFWPSPLVFDYGQEVLIREFTRSAPYAGAVVAALAATVWLFVTGRKVAGFLAAVFFILLSPTSSFVPVVGQPMAESRLYLPLIAIVTLVLLAVGRRAPRWAGWGGAAVALLLGLLTFLRNEDYRTPLTLWEDTIQKHPENSRGQYNFANELLRTPGREGEAIGHYVEALRIKPDLKEAHNNLANELAKRPDRADAALTHYRETLRLEPDLVEAHLNLARLLSRLGRDDEAFAHWARVVELKPNEPEAQFYLANGLAQRPGGGPEAIAHYEAALRLRPDWVEAHNNLGNELAKLPGRLPEAIQHYEEALRLKPDSAEAHCNLANKLARIPGRLPDSFEHYEAALRIRPDFLEAHYNYANKLANVPGRLGDAISHYEAALRINPRLPEAHKNLALALANSGQLAAAAEHLETALVLRPDYAEARELLARVNAAR